MSGINPLLIGGLAVAGYFGYKELTKPKPPPAPDGTGTPPAANPPGTTGGTVSLIPPQLAGGLNDAMLNAYYSAAREGVTNLGDCGVWSGVMQARVWPFPLAVWHDVCTQGTGWLTRNHGKTGADVPEDTREKWLEAAIAKYGS